MAKIKLDYFFDVPTPHRQLVEAERYLVGYFRGNSFVVVSCSHTCELAMSRYNDYSALHPERDFHLIRYRALLNII